MGGRDCTIAQDVFFGEDRASWRRLGERLVEDARDSLKALLIVYADEHGLVRATREVDHSAVHDDRQLSDNLEARHPGADTVGTFSLATTTVHQVVDLTLQLNVVAEH